MEFGFERTDDEDEDCSWWSKGGLRLHQERWRVSEDDVYEGKDFSYPTYMRGTRFKGGVDVPYVHTLQNLYSILERKELTMEPEDIFSKYKDSIFFKGCD